MTAHRRHRVCRADRAVAGLVAADRPPRSSRCRSLASRTCRAGLDPRLDQRAELLLRARRRLALPPGVQPQPTSESCAMCSWIAASVLPPLRCRSLICSQIAPSDRSATPSTPAPDATADGPARRRFEVGDLVAGVAAACRRALAVGAAHRHRQVQMHVVALCGPLADRMAIEAAWVLDHLAGFFEQRARALAAIADRREAVGAAQVGCRRLCRSGPR